MNDSTTPTPPLASPGLRRTVLVVRTLLGLCLIIFGLNAFINFIPQPKNPMPAGAAAFATALVNTGYMMPLIGLTQLICGIFFFFNRFVPLALAFSLPSG